MDVSGTVRGRHPHHGRLGIGPLLASPRAGRCAGGLGDPHTPSVAAGGGGGSGGLAGRSHLDNLRFCVSEFGDLVCVEFAVFSFSVSVLLYLLWFLYFW